MEARRTRLQVAALMAEADAAFSERLPMAFLASEVRSALYFVKWLSMSNYSLFTECLSTGHFKIDKTCQF